MESVMGDAPRRQGRSKVAQHEIIVDDVRYVYTCNSSCRGTSGRSNSALKAVANGLTATSRMARPTTRTRSRSRCARSSKRSQTYRRLRLRPPRPRRCTRPRSAPLPRCTTSRRRGSGRATRATGPCAGSGTARRSASTVAAIDATRARPL